MRKVSFFIIDRDTFRLSMLSTEKVPIISTAVLIRGDYYYNIPVMTSIPMAFPPLTQWLPLGVFLWTNEW